MNAATLRKASRFVGAEYLGHRAAIRLTVARVRRGEHRRGTLREALRELGDDVRMTPAERALLEQVIRDYEDEERAARG